MLEILHLDEHLVVINKPAGLLVHRSSIDRHETRFAVQLLRDQIGRRVFPVHRLDKGTSGVLVFALDAETASHLGKQFSARRKHSSYLAVVRGRTDSDGVIDHPLARPADTHAGISPGTPQPALTRYATLASSELPHRVDRYPTSRYSLLRLEPETGRRHQLRRHLKHVAHPIIGDATYGKGRHNRFFAATFGTRRLLLACAEIELAHPSTGQRLRFVARVGDEFTMLINSLDWQCSVPADWLSCDGRKAEAAMPARAFASDAAW